MPPQYVFEHRTTRGGYHYFIARTAMGNRVVAVSKFAYVDQATALNDVVEQIRQGEKFLRTVPTETPSAAAGGMR